MKIDENITYKSYTCTRGDKMSCVILTTDTDIISVVKQYIGEGVTEKMAQDFFDESEKAVESLLNGE